MNQRFSTFVCIFLFACTSLFSESIDGGIYQQTEDEMTSASCDLPLIFYLYPWMNRFNPDGCFVSYIAEQDYAGDPIFLMQYSQGEFQYFDQEGEFLCGGSASIFQQCQDQLGLSDGIERWNCREGFTPCDNMYTSDDIFNIIPWFGNVVNRSSCDGQRINAYIKNQRVFFLVNDGASSKLYAHDGSLFCTNSPSLDCVEFYDLERETLIWQCNSNDCECSDIEDIVYDIEGNQYQNPCVATCAGVEAQSYDGVFTICLGDTISLTSDYVTDGYTCTGCGGTPPPPPPKYIFWTPSGSCVSCPTTDVSPSQTTEYVAESGYDLCNTDPSCPQGAASPKLYTTYLVVVDQTCGDNPNQNDPIFDDFPWLHDLIDNAFCEEASIIQYESGGYFYLLVSTGAGDVLYYQNGDVLCVSSPNYDCPTAYQFTNVVRTWTCEDDNNGNICTVPIELPDLSSFPEYNQDTEYGYVIYEHYGPEVGYFYEVTNACPFPLLGTGSVQYASRFYTCSGELICRVGGLVGACFPNTFDLDLTLATRTTVAVYSSCTTEGRIEEICEGDRIQIGLAPTPGGAAGPVPCCIPTTYQCFEPSYSVSPSVPIIVENGRSYIVPPSEGIYEVIQDFGRDCAPKIFNHTVVFDPTCNNGEADPIFEDFPWLTDLIDPANCEGATITQYQSGSYFYLQVSTDDGDVLYFQTGSALCVSSPGYDCPMLYSLNAIVDTWTCGDRMSTICTSPIVLPDLSSFPEYNQDTEYGYVIYEHYGPEVGYFYEVTNACPFPLLGTGSVQYASQFYTCGGELICRVGGLVGACFPNAFDLDLTLATRTTVAVYSSCTTEGRIEEICEGDRIQIGLAPTPGGAAGPVPCCIPTTYQCFEPLYSVSPEIPIIEEDGRYYIIPPSEGLYEVVQDFGADCAKKIFNHTVIFDPACEVGDCDNYFGTFFFEDCDDGVEYFFIRLDDGRVFDPYFGDGITFSVEDNQRVKFDFYDADFETPCTIAEKAIIISCVEEELYPEDDQVFIDYPEIFDVYDPLVCTEGDYVEVYQSGSSTFIIISDAGETTLYLSAVTGLIYYCQDTETYSCKTAYQLDEPDGLWRCGGGDGGGPGDGSTIFEDIPWLGNVIQPNNCVGQSVQIFDVGSFSYVYVTIDETKSILYLDNGMVQCTTTPSLDCLEDFGLSNPDIVWECGDACVCSEGYDPVCGTDGVTYRNECEADCAGVRTRSLGPCDDFMTHPFFDTYPWLRNVISESPCDDGSSINVIMKNGQTYILIDEDFGQVRKLYTGSGSFLCMDQPGYNCLELYQLSDISGSYIECGIDGSWIDDDGANAHPIFASYPWLLDHVDPLNCLEQVVAQYEDRIFVWDRGVQTVYNLDGTKACTNNSCMLIQMLGPNPIDIWSCDRSVIELSFCQGQEVFVGFSKLLPPGPLGPNCAPPSCTDVSLTRVYPTQDAVLDENQEGVFIYPVAPSIYIYSRYTSTGGGPGGPNCPGGCTPTWFDDIIVLRDGNCVDDGDGVDTRSFDAIDKFEFKIYPNPSNGVVHLDHNLDKQENASVSVYNAAGQVIKTHQGGVPATLDLTGNQQGLYLIELRTDDRLEVRKVILR